MSKDVTVNWVTESQVVPNALAADHFVVGLGVTEVSVPYNTIRSYTFIGVPGGTWAVWVALVDVAGNELAPPLRGSAVVPDDPQANVPVSINVAVQ